MNSSPPTRGEPKTTPVAAATSALRSLTLPLWQPASRYDFAARRVPAAQRTPAQRARLLGTPATLPDAVREYLDAEARCVTLRRQCAELKRVRAALDAHLVDDGAARAPDGSIETACGRVRAAPPAIRYAQAGKRRLVAGVADGLRRAHGGGADADAVAARAVAFALMSAEVAEPVAAPVADARLVRYRRRRRQQEHQGRGAVGAPLTPAAVRAWLGAPRNADERSVHVMMDETGDAAATGCALLVQRRADAARAALAAERATMQATAPAVCAWLAAEVEGGCFALTDGSLRLRAPPAPRRQAGRESTATRVATFLFAEGQPHAVVEEVYAVTRRLTAATKRARRVG